MSHNVCNVKKASWKASVDFLLPSEDDTEFHTVVAYTLTYEQAAEWTIRKIKSLLSADKIFLSSAIECVDDTLCDCDDDSLTTTERSSDNGCDA